MENVKLKEDLHRLRKSIAESEPENNKVQEYMSEYTIYYSFQLFF